MLLLPLNLDCFLRDDPPQYQAVQFSFIPRLLLGTVDRGTFQAKQDDISIIMGMGADGGRRVSKTGMSDN
jgi:hypothetical protein